MVSTAGANTALGSELFSTNCAQCHGFAGAGGALTYGKNAPSLNASTPTQIYEAMLTGPEAMPVFGDGTVTPAEKKDIIAYITATKARVNRAATSRSAFFARRMSGGSATIGGFSGAFSVSTATGAGDGVPITRRGPVGSSFSLTSPPIRVGGRAAWR